MIKDLLKDLYERFWKNPVSTLIGIVMLVGIFMLYKKMITVEELASMAIAVGAFAALMWKGNNNNPPNTPATK